MPIEPPDAPPSEVRLPHGWVFRATAQAGMTVLTLQDTAGDDREIAFLAGHLVTGDHVSPAVFGSVEDLPSEMRKRAREVITEHCARLDVLAEHESAFAAAFPDLPELIGRVHAAVDDCRVTFAVDPQALAYVLTLSARRGAGTLLTLLHRWLAHASRTAAAPTPAGVDLCLDAASRGLTVTLGHAHVRPFLAWIKDSDVGLTAT